MQATYGYKPVVYTTSPPGVPLANGVVLCHVNSWLTGRRLVSLPFSDHCEPLLDSNLSFAAIAKEFRASVDTRRTSYVELRPNSEASIAYDAHSSATHVWHLLDLTRSPEQILRGAHKTAIQQPIRRAERENLTSEAGDSNRLLELFYSLMLKTRRKHQLPPQPIQWFRNIIECMRPNLTIRVAFKGDRAIASILTINHKNVVMYKYSCADPAYQNTGGTPFLLWQAILEAREAGLTQMDLGRSDTDNPGLIAFKDRWGATSSPLTYVRWSRETTRDSKKHASPALGKRVFSMLPDSVLKAAGQLLYKHVG
jgi:hypothetical protein